MFILLSPLYLSCPAHSQLQSNGVGSEIAGQSSNSNQDIQLITSAYMDSIGSLHVIGELQNTSPDPREFMKIVATLQQPN